MILICAPTRTEADACRRGIAASGRRGLEVLRTGVGPGRAAAALAARLARGGGRPERVVSSGFAGALTAGPALHGWVTARAVEGPDAAAAGGPPVIAVAGVLACRLRPAEGIARAGPPAAATDAPVVADMESAALARVAARAGIPFLVLRLVTDTPATPFPAFADPLARALAGVSPARRLAAAGRAMAGALRRPRAALAFARRSLAAARALEAGWRGWAAEAVQEATEALAERPGRSPAAGP